MTLYVDLEEAESYVRSTISADVVEVQAALTVACSMIDHHCQRTFAVPTEGSTRLFTVSDYRFARVDDIAVTTDLVIVDDGVTLSATDYQLETSVGRVARPGVDGVVRPFAYIRRLSGYFGTGAEATLSVTAWWGWPAIPDDVRLAAKMLTKDLLNVRDTRFGIVQVGDFSRRIADNPVVANLLGPYQSDRVWGIA